MKKRQELSNFVVLLRGTISRLERSRRSHDFVLTQVQHQQIGAAAIAASAMGMGATATGLIGMAGNSDEEADWVEFEVDGKRVSGWLWMMPMRNGDSVEVVAEHMGGNCYMAYAVKRDGDDLLAVYPHATAGRNAHYRNSVKVWMGFTLMVYLVLFIMAVLRDGWGVFLDRNMQIVFLFGGGLGMAISGVMAFRISRKFMVFVRIAETIFRTFGWPDVENIDLRKTSREHRRENRLPNFGNLYFRYK